MIDLSGRWSGSYCYPGSLDPVPFVADLRDAGGYVSGLIDEDGAGFGRAGRMHATLAGRHDGAVLTFTKIYDAHNELLEPVQYDGAIGDDGHEVSGSWTIAGDWSGPFVMTRPRTTKAKEAAEVGAKI